MTLEEITEMENEWLEKHPKGGQDDLCQQLGIYEAWSKIFGQYVILAKKGELEALKRALFLYWYSRSEPRELCGIPILNEDLIKEVLGMVDDMIQKGELDAELKWMLPHYYLITDWYIDRFEGLDALKELSKKNDNLWMQLCLKMSFSNRGQLGNYWNSIRDSMLNKKC
jgi:hypothetical protein